MEEKKIIRDIIENSYYMIYLFYKKENIKKAEITNLKLQKLMYFVEAYYMVDNKEQLELFDTGWSAWDYGPVNKKLYKYYKKYGSMPILLSHEEIDKIKELPEINRKYIDKIFNIFSNFTAFELVTLTHLDGSPWSELYKENNREKRYDFAQLNESEIDKEITRDWFEKEFSFLFQKGEDN